MRTYRIKKHSNGWRKWYEIQRLSIFGFWWNPDNGDEWANGEYSTFEEAEMEVKKKLTPQTSKVIKIYK